MKKIKTNSYSYNPIWKRKETQIGIWKPTNTFEVENLPLFKFVLQNTYGNFSFQRGVSKCFGLNAYTGKFFK